MDYKRARYDRAHLLSTGAQKKTVKHKFSIGQMVSLGGRKVTLDSLEPPDSEDPTTCWVTDRNGKSLHVRVDSLRPLAAEIVEKIMPKSQESIAPGVFVIFDTPGGLASGRVVSADGDCIAVHTCHLAAW